MHAALASLAKVLLRRNSRLFRVLCSKDARRSISGGDGGTDVVHVIFEVSSLFLAFAGLGVWTNGFAIVEEFALAFAFASVPSIVQTSTCESE